MRAGIFISIFASSLTFISAAPYKRAISCPSTNKEDAPLLSQGSVDNLPNGISCQYEGDFCAYFSNGSFSSGSSTCPVSLSEEKEKEEAKETEPYETPAVPCLPVDNNGNPLTNQGKTDNPVNGVTCQYGRQSCIYFQNGSFSSGSSACPVSLSPRGLQPKPITGTPPAATKACSQRDNDGNTLSVQDETNDPINGVTCKYTNGPFCSYFRSGGFSSGSSVCPFGLVDA